MNNKRNQHVVPSQGKWGVRGEGSSRLSSSHSTQQAAIARAREIAIKQQSEVVIHRRNGQIRDKDSYGKDPFPPRDQKH